MFIIIIGVPRAVEQQRAVGDRYVVVARQAEVLHVPQVAGVARLRPGRGVASEHQWEGLLVLQS